MDNFPVFASHDDARCFSCDATFDPRNANSGVQPHGRGHYMNYCRACEMRTWYDLAHKVSQ